MFLPPSCARCVSRPLKQTATRSCVGACLAGGASGSSFRCIVTFGRVRLCRTIGTLLNLVGIVSYQRGGRKSEFRSIDAVRVVLLRRREAM